MTRDILECRTIDLQVDGPDLVHTSYVVKWHRDKELWVGYETGSDRFCIESPRKPYVVHQVTLWAQEDRPSSVRVMDMSDWVEAEYAFLR